MRRLALLLCLLFPPLLLAAPPTLTLPKEVTGDPGTFIAIRAESDSDWVNFKAEQGLAVFPSGLLSDKKATVITARAAGRYKLFAYTGNKDGGVDAEIVVIVGDVPPGPVPPGPTPPGPTPPVPSGKRVLLLVHESSDDVPEVARMIVGLRSGPAADYLKSKGHELSILDVDDKNADGSPSYLVEAWRPHLTGMVLPALFVLDEDGKNLIHKQNVPMNSTANNVLDIVKGHGG